MASIGSVTLEFVDGPSASAVAFWLPSKPASDVDFTLDSGWQVTVRSGQAVVVARTKAILARQDILTEGTSSIEEVLDLACFRLNERLQLKSGDRDCVILETACYGRALTFKTVAPWGVRASLSIVAHDKDGNIKPSSPNKPKWQPVLRYYRLSQTRENMFDAYRYMFLALEALLYSLWPPTVKPKERELDWLTRAVDEMGHHIDLRSFVSSPVANLAEAFVKEQYTQFRLPLFHAKKSSLTLPHEGLSESDVSLAYSKLTRLIREGLNKFFQLQGQSSVVSATVLQAGIADLLNTADLRAVFSFDDDAIDVAAEHFSPRGDRVFEFDRLDAEPATNTESRTVVATLAEVTQAHVGPICRLGLVANSKALLVAKPDDFIEIDGIRQLKFELTFKFLNLNTPKWT